MITVQYLRRRDKSMSGRISIISSCKVSVKRCDNGVLLSLLDVTSASKI